MEEVIEETKKVRDRSRDLIRKRSAKNYLFQSSLYKPYMAYCKSKGIKKCDILDRDGLVLTGIDIFREISNQLVEREGGVMVNRFGYFFIYVTRGHVFKQLNRDPNNLYFKPTRGGEKIHYIFMPYEEKGNLKLWGMDYGFKSSFKRRVREKVFEGKKYKGYPYTLRGLLNRNDDPDYEGQILTKKIQDAD